MFIALIPGQRKTDPIAPPLIMDRIIGVRDCPDRKSCLVAVWSNGLGTASTYTSFESADEFLARLKELRSHG